VPKITTAVRVDLDDVSGVVVIEVCMSVLTQRFTHASLGELVLAHDALGVDPQQHVHAVPGPLRHLGGVDAAVEPRGQARMPKVKGRLARGEACSASVRAICRALTQARR
jgi:hypothetical protein